MHAQGSAWCAILNDGAPGRLALGPGPIGLIETGARAYFRLSGQEFEGSSAEGEIETARDVDRVSSRGLQLEQLASRLDVAELEEVVAAHRLCRQGVTRG